MPVKLKWEGNKAARHIDERIAAAMHRAGSAWTAEARRLAPAKTGTLRASIGYVYDRASRTLVLGSTASYAVFVEFGTRLRAAVPFLRPALGVIPRAVQEGSSGADDAVGGDGAGGEPASGPQAVPTPPKNGRIFRRRRGK